MAKKPFISVDGITVGEANALVNVIASNGDITTSNITVSNNANLGNAGNVIITGGSNGYVLSTNGSGALSWVAQSGGGSTSNISNGNSNVSIATANGNITMSAVGNANIVVVTGTGANINGYANISGNVTAGNIIAGTGSGGNISGANVVSANTFTATGNITAGNANLGNSVIANYFIGNFYGTANSATTAGTVTTAAQPNITSVGTLTGLTSTGTVNLTGASNVALGPVANVHITGGTNGQYLSTDGSGILSWSTISVSSASISNGNSNVNIPSSNGNVNISAVGNANVLIVTGTGVNVAGTGNFTGNLTAGNLIAGSGSGGNISGANNISANTLTGALTTAAQPNITSVGTLTSLAVTGNISSGNANLGNAVIANFFIGSGANLTSIPAGNISGQVANALVAGTVYTNAQPNITSVGTLTSANVTGNIVSNANVVTDLIVGRTSGITITATGTNQNINLTPTGTGTVNVGNFIISNVQTPVADFDAATKKYVDDVAQGLNIHDSVQAATPTTLATITSGTITYNNGASGVGANLVTTGSFNLIDGVNVQTSGTRILVKNEANAVHNGIYTWSNATVITRATDYNSVPEVEAGDFVFVTGGTLYDNTGWVQVSTVSAIGTAGNNIEFTQFSGAGTYTAGTGLTLTGSVFSITNTTVTAGSYGNGDTVATFTVNSQGQLSAAANVAITANAANLTGTTLATGIVTSSLTSVGTLTGLTSNGIVNFTNTSNVTLGAVSNLHISGGTNAYVLSTDGSGNLSWVAQSAGGAISNISNGNSNVNIATANGNITFSAVGNANVMTITGTGANINGTANITGNVALNGSNVSLGTVSNLHITGGSNGYVLTTDGTGNLSWAAQTGSNIVIDTFTGNGVQTVFTLTDSPASEDYTIINIDGVSQLHSAYTVANANVTLSSAPASGAVIEVMTFNLGGAAGSSGSSGYTYVEATGNTTASVNTKYIVNTNTANLTITLPSTPSFGDEVGIIDGTGNASVHAITVARNGGNIQGAASDMTVTTDRSAFTLVYYNASQGWVLTNV
jgi:predicted regulator of Ras-like GTPase activity (Roadblock/LC7/MglB family)